MTIRSSAARDLPGDAIRLDLTDELPLQGPSAAAPASREVSPLVPVTIRGWSLAHLGVSAALAVLCVALAAVVYAEITQDERARAHSAASVLAKAPSAAANQTGAPFALPPLDRYGEVTARPLFSPTRRAPPLQAGQRGSLESASLVLTGVIVVGDDRTALVQEVKSPKPTRLKEGQEIQGWTVQSILPDRIVLRRGSVEQEVRFHEEPARPPVGVPGVAGAPATTVRGQ